MGAGSELKRSWVCLDRGEDIVRGSHPIFGEAFGIVVDGGNTAQGNLVNHGLIVGGTFRHRPDPAVVDHQILESE